MRREFRIIRHLFAAIIAVALFGSCTHNNGYIGDWFGVWRVTSIDIDGTPVEDYNGGVFFMFQNDLICVTDREDYMYHNAARSWGRWSEDSNGLTLDFSYTSTDENYAGYYVPEPASYLEDGVNHLTISDRTSKSMTLRLIRYIDSDEHIITYKLHKQ
jgi:hypothetical protein